MIVRIIDSQAVFKAVVKSVRRDIVIVRIIDSQAVFKAVVKSVRRGIVIVRIIDSHHSSSIAWRTAQYRTDHISSRNYRNHSSNSSRPVPQNNTTLVSRIFVSEPELLSQSRRRTSTLRGSPAQKYYSSQLQVTKLFIFKKFKSVFKKCIKLHPTCCT